MKSIYEFSGCASWLAHEVAAAKARNPHLSQSALAKRWDMSPAQLHLMIKGERSLTLAKAKKLKKEWRLTDEEFSYLYLLIQKDKTKDLEMKKILKTQIDSFKKNYQVDQITLDMFNVMSDWHYSALLEAVRIKEYSKSAESLSEYLGLPLEKTQKALKILIGLKLFERVDGHYQRSSEGFISTPTNLQSKALRTFHAQTLEMAKEALHKQKVENRTITGMTMAIDPEKLPEAQKRLREFSRNLAKFLESGEKKKVYHLGMQIFELKNIGEKNEKK